MNRTVPPGLPAAVEDSTGTRRSMRIVAHRGTAIGGVAENTDAAALLAIQSGADVIEVDAAPTKDGRIMAFHDGTERENLGIDRWIHDLDHADLMRYPYLTGWWQGADVVVQDLEHVLRTVLDLGAEAHLDRAWTCWQGALDVVRRIDDPRVAVKLRMEPEHLDIVQAHSRAWTPGTDDLPVIPICRTPDEALTAAELLRAPRAGVTVVAVELVTAGDHPSEFTDATFLRRLSESGAPLMANGLGLRGVPPLMGPYGDEMAVMEDAGSGWGRLVELGYDIVQTDMPWLLSRYRDEPAR